MYDTAVTVVGNIATDVSSRRVGDDGQMVVSFRVASTARRRDKVSGEWVDGDRFSARVSCWRALGEGVLTSLAKGDPVVVSGRVSVREYEVDGERRYSTEITADAVGPDLARSSAQVRRRRAATADEVVAGETGEAPTGSGALGAGAGSPRGFAAAASLGVTTGTMGPIDDVEVDVDDQDAALASAV